MKFLIQRVSQASVHIVDTHTTNAINEGYLIYVGVSAQDISEDRKMKVDKFVRRVGRFDLFSNDQQKKHLTLQDIQGELLIISNFTLYGRNKKGSGIDFCHAAKFDEAKLVYDYLITELHKTELTIQTGEFGAMMEVQSTVFGPVNVVLEW